jgi:hypothetical protein
MQKKPAKNFLADCCRSMSDLFFGKETTPTPKGKKVSLEENPLLGRRRSHISGGKRKGGARTHRNKRVTILDIIDFLKDATGEFDIWLSNILDYKYTMLKHSITELRSYEHYTTGQ